MKYLKFLFLALLVANLAASCGRSDANSIRGDIVPGPAGVTCYAIIQNGEARGGNCQ
jgi:hypothetical protein